MTSFLKKTIVGLTKTRQNIRSLFVRFQGKTILTQNNIDEMEEILLASDMGWDLTDSIINMIKKPDMKNMTIEDRFKKCVKGYLEDITLKQKLEKIILIVGVNGTGKTTSAAKLAGYYSGFNESVSLVAADTFRSAAVKQISIWAKRLNIHLTSNEKSTDPASVAYDGVSSGLSRDLDRIIIDTSGRVHNSPNLMKELEKIYRVIKKLSEKIDVLITIDSNTGQNAINQVREFLNYINISGVILTKMDGTARGGIAITIMKELKIPVYFIGIGEDVNDLIPFDMDSYIDGLIMLENQIDE